MYISYNPISNIYKLIQDTRTHKVVDTFRTREEASAALYLHEHGYGWVKTGIKTK